MSTISAIAGSTASCWRNSFRTARHDLSHLHDGKLACPPEDCGGIPGYYNLLEALADPQHPEHEEMREWIGDDFDPQVFSVDSVNRKLAPKRRRSSLPKN